MNLEKERIGNLHAQINNVFIKMFEFCAFASLEHDIRVEAGICEQVLAEFSDGAELAIQMVLLEFFIDMFLLGDAGKLHRQIMAEEAIHIRALRLIDE